MRSLRLLFGVVVGLVMVGALSWSPAPAAAGSGSVGGNSVPSLSGMLDGDRNVFAIAASGAPTEPGLWEVVIADSDPLSTAPPAVFYFPFTFNAAGLELGSIPLISFAFPQDVTITTRVYTYSPTMTLLISDPWTVRTHHFATGGEGGSSASSLCQWLPLSGTTAPLFPYSVVITIDPNPAQIPLPAPQMLAIESGPTGLFPVN